jgi:hypothetical protein
MPYSVELAETAVRKVISWNLSSGLQSEILKRLDELGADPTRLLARLPEPSDCLVFEFTARELAVPPRDYLFSFSVVYRSDEQTIVIYDGDLLVIEVDPG